MRAVVLVLAVLAVSCGAYNNRLDLLQEPISGVAYSSAKSGKLVGFLENLKKWMKSGNEKPSIPILDPLKKDHLPLNVDNKKTGITVDAVLDNLRALGLSEFDINKGDFKIIGLEANIDVSWKNIDLFTMYDLINARIESAAIAFHGKGAILAVLKDLQIAAVAKLNINEDDRLFLKDIDLKIQLGKLQFNATGLLGDEELSKLISQIVSDLIPQILRDFPDEISKQGGALVKEVMDDVLSKLTLQDLLELLG